MEGTPEIGPVIRALAVALLILSVGCADVAPAAADPRSKPRAPSVSASAPVPATSRLVADEPAGALAISLSVTSPASPGSTASTTARTAPRASCEISVTYASGPSEAQGLVPRSADASGSVSWSWIVGLNTTPGSWPVDVRCASPSGETVDARVWLVVERSADQRVDDEAARDQ